VIGQGYLWQIHLQEASGKLQKFLFVDQYGKL
jgi:hypothetical protein